MSRMIKDANLGERIEALAHQFIGAALEVHKELGPGYLESVYEEALCHELSLRGIQFSRQYVINVEYKGHRVGESRVDLLLEGAVVVELKAVESLAPVHEAQIISYLKATHCRLGLLINFNVSLLKEGIRRIVL